MLKGLRKDLTGRAKICTTATDFRQLQAAWYLLPGETVMFAFISSKKEFAFTNEALIMIVGESATTTRKLVHRMSYQECPIYNVVFETTGRLDRDCAIQFRIGQTHVSIEIARKEEASVKRFYKTLWLLGREQETRMRTWEQAQKGLDRAAKSLTIRKGHELVSQASHVAAWLENTFFQYNSRCYRDIITAAMKSTAPSV
ncbi:hypothetical protein CCR75_008816 [Bremia lactucae]|uniref:Bacterial Pleckstrin homology domain-containing protein n=1 Tax=Bremia lactucae TaxID=4779 RepID=A0A976FGW5_BRELC|nr:hypothetical protein CCR75_008816 [Bremia lactucae]